MIFLKKYVITVFFFTSITGLHLNIAFAANPAAHWKLDCNAEEAAGSCNNENIR